MSQPAYLKNLKEYVRQQLGGTAAHPTIAVQNVMGESDRGAVILAATSVEDMLEWAILARLPGLLVDVTARDGIFGVNGSLGTFSSKIAMAYAMAIVGKELRREIDLIREMRNACAHARLILSFNEQVLRDVAKQVFPEALGNMVDPDNPVALRHMFVLKCTIICQSIITGEKPDLVGEMNAVFKARQGES